MRKGSVKYYDWIKQKNSRRFLKRSRIKRRKKNNSHRKQKTNSMEKTYKQFPDESIELMRAPKTFGFFANRDETIDYFDDIINYLLSHKKESIIMFDVSKVTYLGVDALIYLLSIIHNFKGNEKKQYRFSGNFPKDEETSQVMCRSGFLKYVRTSDKLISTTDNNYEIKIGGKVNQNIVVEICDFVNNKFGTNRLYTKFLYDILLELMMNTHQHAYNKSEFVARWYIFVQCEGDIIKFTFHDTGEGIPQTVSKKMFERLGNFMFSRQVDFLISAFLGEDRSKTKLSYRGKGLPRLFKYCSQGKIQNFSVISSKAFCKFDPSDITLSEQIELERGISGTLYYWELNRNR